MSSTDIAGEVLWTERNENLYNEISQVLPNELLRVLVFLVGVVACSPLRTRALLLESVAYEVILTLLAPTPRMLRKLRAQTLTCVDASRKGM